MAFRWRALLLHLTNYCIHLSCLLRIFILVYEITKRTRIHDSAKEPLLKAGYWRSGLPGYGRCTVANQRCYLYLVQRMASLMTLFYVSAIASYVQADRSI